MGGKFLELSSKAIKIFVPFMLFPNFNIIVIIGNIFFKRNFIY
jgi:hypothetical protein